MASGSHVDEPDLLVEDPISSPADSWERYLGSVWAAVLGNHELDATGVVVEIGPGFGAKIGLALAEVGFAGTLFVVEPAGEACRRTIARYRRLLPDAELIPVESTMRRAVARLPAAVEAVLMNHVLDDLIVRAALAPERRDAVFSDPGDPGAGLRELQRTWRGLLADPGRLDRLCRRVHRDLGGLLAATRPRILGISQYSSWFLTRNRLGRVEPRVHRLLVELAARLGATSPADEAVLRAHDQDPRRWLILNGARYRGGVPMAGEVTVESTRLLLDDRFQVEEGRLRHRLPDGSLSGVVRRLALERGDSAAALVIQRDRGTAVLVRQFRYPAYRRGTGWLTEVVAGSVDPGETPEETVRREVLEEIGYRVGELIPIHRFFTSPGSGSERIHLFCAVVGDADVAGPGGGRDDEMEDIEVEEIPLDEIGGLISGGRVEDAKTLIALQWLRERLAGGSGLEGIDGGG